MNLPAEMTLPSEEWPAGYQKFTGTLHQPRPELLTVEDALTRAGRLLNPLLTMNNQMKGKVWSAEAQQWVGR